jgi:signal transduction histidine kinase
MARVLFVEPEDYSELEVSLQEEGIEYDRATEDEAEELFSRIDYDGVVGPEISSLYDAASEEDVPYLAFDSFGRDFTDTLSGRPEVDAQRVDHYLDNCPNGAADFFLSILRHDAGNDLNVAAGYAEILKEEDDNEDHEEYWQVIKDKLHSVEDLLETSKVVSSLSEGETQEVNLNRALEEAIHDYEAQAREEGFDIPFNYDDEYNIEAGPLLEDLYGQLIENSINHSDGSLIDVNVSGSDRFVRVDVEDDGVGIPEDQQDAVLQKGVTNGDSGNTGLGMFLASEIADRYDIHLEAGESEEHGGARFTTVIPRSDQE